MSDPVASEPFDPYHKWLGISRKDQPPHLYRLLAIDLFESDLDVISSAADKQMAFIRSFQSGKDGQVSQKILNEIAAARVCLLNPAKKAQYDGALRAKLAAKASASGLRKAEPILLAEVEPVIPVAQLATPAKKGPPPLELGSSSSIHSSRVRSSSGMGSSIIRSSQKRKPKNMALIWSIAGAGAVLLGGGVTAVVLMSRSTPTEVAQNDGTQKDGIQQGDDSTRGAANGARPPQAAPAPSGRISPAANSARTVAIGPSGSVPQPNKHKPPKRGKVLEVLPPDESQGKDPPADLGDPLAPDKPDETGKPAPNAKPAAPEKVVTLDEADKHLADAKSPDDYRAVTDEALRAAARAVDEHHEDVAKKFALKALTAARKSGDSNLVVKATRALIKPETIKEMLAESPPADASPSIADPPHGDVRPSEPNGGNVGPTVARGTPVRVKLFGSKNVGLNLGAVLQGTVVEIQYESGEWTNPTTHESINPDEVGTRDYRIAIVTKSGDRQRVHHLPQNTAAHSFRWRANQDFDTATLQCYYTGDKQPLNGFVIYRMTILPP